MPKNFPTQPKQRRNQRLRRGEAELYRDLQAKSMAARINRKFEVQVKVVQAGAVVPFRMRRTDAGWDVASGIDRIIEPGELAWLPTGIAVCCPEGYAFSLVGRSSLNIKGLVVPPNVIDAGYTGEIKGALLNTTKQHVHIHQGDRIGQLVFFPILHPDLKTVQEFTLAPDARGHAGFGASGR